MQVGALECRVDSVFAASRSTKPRPISAPISLHDDCPLFARNLLFSGGNNDGQPSATMMMGYLYMVGSEEKMGITPDFAKAEQVRNAGVIGHGWRHCNEGKMRAGFVLCPSVGRCMYRRLASRVLTKQQHQCCSRFAAALTSTFWASALAKNLHDRNTNHNHPTRRVLIDQSPRKQTNS